MLTIPSAVEEALKNGAQKNFRVHFPNGERADITNDNIVSESVSFTESICSQSELKFGLAEASVLEFETVGVENIRGAEIEASVETELDVELLTLPYFDGFSKTTNGITFTVNSDGSVTANGTATGVATFEIRNGFSIHERAKYVLSGCAAGGFYPSGYYILAWIDNNPVPDTGREPRVFSGRFCTYVQIFISSGITVENLVFKPSIKEISYSIPYGKFVVDECPRQTNLEHRKITAYSKSVGSNMSEVDMYGFPGTQTSRDALFSALMNLDISDRLNFLTYTNVSSELTNKTYNKTSRIELHLRSYSVSDTLTNIGYGVYVEKVASRYSADGIINALRNHGITDENLLAQVRQIYNKYKNAILATANTSWVTDTTVQNSYFDLNSLVFFGGIGLLGIVYEIKVDDYTISFRNPNQIKMYRVTASDFNINDTNLEDVMKNNSMQELLSACLELRGYFGRTNRNGIFDVISLNNNFEDACYEIQKSDYSSLWYEENQTLPYGRVSVTYTDLSDQEVTAEYVVSNEYPSLTYDISNNLVIKNTKFDSSEIDTILSTLASNIGNIRYIASDISSVGLPFLEAGDVIDVVAGDDNLVRTFVEKRTISGIQALFDDISSEDTRNTYISGGSSSGGSSGGGGGTPSPVVVNDSTITIEQGNFSDSFTLNQSSNKTISLPEPTIPTVNDGTLTIKQDGTTLGTFSANQSGNTTVNITGGGGGGGGTTTLESLWTNSSPSSSFTAKTVSLDLQNYDFLIIGIRFTTTTDNYANVIVKTDGTSVVEAFLASSNRYRRSISANSSGITFGGGEKASPSATSYSSDNTCYIPIYVYGFHKITGANNFIDITANIVNNSATITDSTIGITTDFQFFTNVPGEPSPSYVNVSGNTMQLSWISTTATQVKVRCWL